MAEMKRSKPGANLLRYPGGKSKLWSGKLEKVMPAGGGLFSPERYVDHERLKEWLTRGDQDWVVTYDDCDLIRNLYANHTITEIVNATGNNNSKVELIITK